MSGTAVMQKTIREKRSQVKTLAEALNRYGVHWHACPENVFSEGEPCDCGFNQALTAARQWAKDSEADE